MFQISLFRALTKGVTKALLCARTLSSLHTLLRSAGALLLFLTANSLAIAAPINSAHREQKPKHHVANATEPVSVSLNDFGAAGDGVTDDGPALQAALEAIANHGGGELFVPDGHYAIVTPVVVDFGGLNGAVTIK